MAGKPAARVTDPTSCSESGHGENPLVSGSPDFIIEGFPAARFNDPTECGSLIVGGEEPTVWINGMRAAVVGSQGSHGNKITAGASTVIFGNTHIPAPFTPPSPMARSQEFNQTFKFFTDQGVVAGLNYRISSSAGVGRQGATSEQGKTKTFSTGRLAEQLTIYVNGM